MGWGWVGCVCALNGEEEGRRGSGMTKNKKKTVLVFTCVSYPTTPPIRDLNASRDPFHIPVEAGGIRCRRCPAVRRIFGRRVGRHALLLPRRRRHPHARRTQGSPQARHRTQPFSGGVAQGDGDDGRCGAAQARAGGGGGGESEEGEAEVGGSSQEEWCGGEGGRSLIMSRGRLVFSSAFCRVPVLPATALIPCVLLALCAKKSACLLLSASVEQNQKNCTFFTRLSVPSQTRPQKSRRCRPPPPP